MDRTGLSKKLIEKVNGKIKINQKQAIAIVDALFDSIKEGLLEDGIVKIHDFGKFEVRERAAKKGSNPQTGEPIDIPARKTVFLKMSNKFKNKLNNM